MKRLVFCAIALLLFNCKNETTDTTATATAGDTAATFAASDTTATTVPAADLEFATKASMANLAEIKMGELAIQKGTRADVKAFGERMVKDHTAIGANYAPIAQAQGLPAPTTLDAAAQAEYDSLAALSGADFDKMYAQHAVTDHTGAVSLFETESTAGQDPQLKDFATTTLPTIKEHLALAKQLASGG